MSTPFERPKNQACALVRCSRSGLLRCLSRTGSVGEAVEFLERAPMAMAAGKKREPKLGGSKADFVFRQQGTGSEALLKQANIA